MWRPWVRRPDAWSGLHLQATTGRRDVADHHVLGAQGLPVAVDDLGRRRRQADHVLPRDRGIHAGVVEVIADNLSHVLRQHAAALPAERHHGDRRGTVATGGDQQRIGCLDGTDQQAQAQQGDTNQGIHRAKSSGLKIIRR